MSVERKVLISMSFQSNRIWCTIQSRFTKLEVQGGGKSGQRVQTSSYKKREFWVVMHSRVTIISNTVLYI